MGTTTPNMSIYIPSAGETNYSQSFMAGMMNVDQHDHSGGPNKGVPISSSGLADFSVTYDKLNANVVDSSSGIGTRGSPFQNQLTLLGYIKALYTLSLVPGIGFVIMNGGVAAVRTFQNSANIAWTNAAGTAGNPSAALLANAINTSQSAFRGIAAAQPNVTGNSVDYKVQFATTDYNQGSNFVGGATSQYTAPVTGRYLVTEYLTLSGTFNDQNRTRVQIWKNGVFYVDLYDFDTSTQNGNGPGVTGSGVFQFTAGDVITLNLFVNNTSQTNVVGITSGSFTITLLTA